MNAYRDIVNAIKTAEKKKYAEGRAEGIEEGMAKGRAEGLAEGERTAKEKIAERMLSLGVPVETVVKASGLTEDEVKRLLNGKGSDGN